MAFQYKHTIGVAAHRGDSYNYYENTWSAFHAALACGADMIETDVHMTKDLVPVLIHDDKVDRTSDGRGYVRDMTLAELEALNFGDANAPERIPLFEDFMAWISTTDLTVNIEIKEFFMEGNESRSIHCIEEVISIVEKYGMGDRILINSFDALVLEYCYKKWGKRYPLHGFYPFSHHKNLDKAEIDPTEYLFCACIFDAKNKALFEDLKKMRIEPWLCAAVTQKGLLETAIENGARLITTNFPADIIKKLEVM